MIHPTATLPSLAMIAQFALLVGLTMIAIILHELAHGYAAWAMGDTTARLAGRLSLNPLRHVDRVGTIILPGILLLGQLLTIGRVLFMFGWAKPVPVDPTCFRYPRQQMAVVAIAGPVCNFILAFAGALSLRLHGLTPGWATAIVTFIELNLVLGLFNLVPIPPLDGGRIAVGILPWRLARQWARLEGFGIPFVLIFLTAGPALLRNAGIPFDPLGHTLVPALNWVFDHLLSLAHVPVAAPEPPSFPGPTTNV
jgi:Zn-dependent protease